MYICHLYDNEAWIGLVQDVSDEHEDLFWVHFMHPHGPSQVVFHWPNTKMTCVGLVKSDIICVIDAPSLAPSQQMYCLK